MHGSPAAACKTNLGGAVLALVSLAAGPWMLACAAKGRWLAVRPSDRWLALAAMAWMGVTLVDWCWRTM